MVATARANHGACATNVQKPSSTTNVHDGKYIGISAEPCKPTPPVEKVVNGSTQEPLLCHAATNHNTTEQSSTKPDFSPPILATNNSMERQQILATMVDMHAEVTASTTSTSNQVGPTPTIAETRVGRLDVSLASAFSAVSGHRDAAVPTLDQDTSSIPPLMDIPSTEDDSPEGVAHRQGTRYEGPVDVDNVSLTSSIHSSVHSSDGNSISYQEETLVSPKTNNVPNDGGVPESPATPLTSNLNSNWLVHEKEPFEHPRRMPPSPPVSMRHILMSSSRLPVATTSTSASHLNVSHHSTAHSTEGHYLQTTTTTTTMTTSSNNPLSPPLSPLNLDASVIGFSSSEFRVVEDISDHPTESPPLSPFEYDGVSHQKQLLQSRLALLSHGIPGPPCAASRGTPLHNCSAHMLDMALSLPPTITPASALVTPIEDAPSIEDGFKSMPSLTRARTLKRNNCSARMLELALQLPYTITPESALVTPIEASDTIMMMETKQRSFTAKQGLPTRTLKRNSNCSARMLELALALPYTITPESALVTPIEASDILAIDSLILSEPVDLELATANTQGRVMQNTLVTKEDVHSHREKTDGGEDDMDAEMLVFSPPHTPTPSSPPTLSRQAWLGNDLEPFHLAAKMQEEPPTPPMSGTNTMGARIIRQVQVGSDDASQSKSGEVAKTHSIMVMSPPISPRPAELDMTSMLLEELNQSQVMRNQRSSRKGLQGNKSHRSQQKRQELQSAQQVVRVILKGTDGHKYTNAYDMTSPPACYEAVRQYALLRVETSNLTSQLENSKQQLKDLYCEWKELSRDMNPMQAQVKACNTDDLSVRMLQQLLSDDESIYKEDDEDESPVHRHEKFCMSRHVDDEKDAAKAMAALYHEIQNELNAIRSTWLDQREQQQLHQSMHQTEKRDQPDESDIEETANVAKSMSSSVDPFSETNDSFLLTKIEEFTEQIHTMEKDRMELTGYMDQLAHDVISMDNTSFSQSNASEDNELEGDEAWTSFSHNFPIYQVKESDKEDRPDADDDAEVQEGEARVPQPTTCGEEKMSLPDTGTGIVQSPAFKPTYRPLSLALRTRRFHGSSDSDRDLMLPIRLPGSRGVSFELKKESLNDLDEEDELRVQTFAEIPLGKQTRTISFDSVFSRRNGGIAKSSSWFKKRKSDSRLLRKTRSTDSSNASKTLLLAKNGDPAMEHLLTDPYSVPPAPQALALDAELVRRLESPMLQLELSLPPKALPMTYGNGSDDLPASPNSSIKSPHEGGYVKLCTKLIQVQKDLQQTQTHLKRLQMQEQQAMHELAKSGHEAGNVFNSAGFRSSTATSASMVSSLDYSIDTRESLFLPPTKPLVARQSKSTAVSSLAFSLASEVDLSDGENSTGSRAPNNDATQLQLLEKTEECTRLSQQVQSLSDQLEHQLHRIAMLEKGFNHSSTNEMDASRGSDGSDRSRRKSAKIRPSRVRAGLRNIISRRLHGDSGNQKSDNKRKSLSYAPMGVDCDEKANQEDVLSLGAVDKEDSPVGATINAIFERDVQPLVEFSIDRESPDGAEQSSCPPPLGGSDSGGTTRNGGEIKDESLRLAANRSSSTQLGVPHLKCLPSMDDSHAGEDAQLSTIHLLRSRIEELEAENRKLKEN